MEGGSPLPAFRPAYPALAGHGHHRHAHPRVGRCVGEVGQVAWARALNLAQIAKKAPPHTLRHTAATWLMRQGVDRWEAGDLLGMSTDVLERTYGKHHPDFMAEAASAITRKRPKSWP